MATILQQRTIATTPGDWSASLPFNQFDPSTGTLQDAIFTTTGTVEASASIENLAPVAATIDLGVAANIYAYGAVTGIGNVAAINPLAVASVELPAFQGTFDGIVDFSGPSGTILPNLSGTASQTTVVNPGTQGGGTPLVGTGTFDVTVTSDPVSTVRGNGNLAVLLHGSTGVTVSLGYEATSPSSGDSSYYGGATSVFGGITVPFYSSFANDVTTVPQVVTLPSQTSGWSGIASFNRFDPALGRLDAIVIETNNTLTSTFAAENLENAPATISMTETASMTVAIPGDPAGLVANASNRDSLNLGRYDGTTDLAGTSGGSDSVSGMNWFGGPYAEFTDATDLAAFSGSGTIGLPVTTAGNSVVTGPANLFTEMTQQTGGTVTVSYVYSPATSGGNISGADTGMVAFPGIELTAAACSSAMVAPGMTFLGPFSGGGWVSAHGGDTFMIGSGANASIGGFSLAAGDVLNLTDVLAGAKLAHDLSNLGAFLSVTGQSSPAGGGWNTTLAAQGPNGAASLVLQSGNAMTVLDLLHANALVLPAH